MTTLSLRWLIALVPAVALAAGGWSRRWTTEDGFIYFRVAENLVGGHGPVFNVGERVEAYTSPLWVGLLAAARVGAPGVEIEWIAVVLGLLAATSGMVASGIATQVLGARRGARTSLPLGLIVFAALPVAWDFSTSGLETGLTFAWIGASWLLLVRVLERRRGPVPAAFTFGLGPLVRPDLGVISVAFIVALGVIIASPDWLGPMRTWARWLRPLACAIALPVGYQLFRMAYFALLVPNTALAKSAGSSKWSEGAHYVVDFVQPYALWIPVLLVAPFVVRRVRRWQELRDRSALAVIAAPLVGGGAHATYIARLGGDFMHGRLLLPALLALCLVLWVSFDRLPSPSGVAVAGVVGWAVICAVALRPALGTGGVVDERAFWVAAAKVGNPVRVSDYGASFWGQLGDDLHAAAGGAGRVRRVRGLPIILAPDRRSVTAAFLTNIGIAGFVAGPGIHVFDGLSLANPIGSHTIVRKRLRIGHEKPIDAEWMLARLAPPGVAAPRWVSTRAVADARAALNCDPLADYLRSITSPLDARRALANVGDAWGYTRLAFDAEPRLARAQLCAGE